MRSPNFFLFPGIKLPRDSDHAECPFVRQIIYNDPTRNEGAIFIASKPKSKFIKSRRTKVATNTAIGA